MCFVVEPRALAKGASCCSAGWQANFLGHTLCVCRCVEKVFSLGGLVAQFCRYSSSLFEHEDTLFASLSEFMGALHSDACGNLIKYLVLHILHLLSL